MRKHTMIVGTLLVLVFLLTVPGFAGDSVGGECGKGVYWNLTGTTLTISGSGAVIDYDYSNEAPWIPYSEAIVHLVVEDGVTALGDNAMYGCQKLLDVSLPRSLTRIGDSAFYRCQVLGNVILPETVTELGSGAFESCDMLESVYLPAELTTIPERTFSGCSLLTGVELPEKITSIGNSAFYGSGLKTVTLPDGVTELGSSVFSGCSGLTEIQVSAGNRSFLVENGLLLTADKTRLIQALPGITELIFPEGLTEIGGYALAGCDKLPYIEIPEGVTRIGAGALENCVSAKYLLIPVSVEELGYSALETGEYYGLAEATADIYYGGDEIYWNALMEQSMSTIETATVHFHTTQAPVTVLSEEPEADEEAPQTAQKTDAPVVEQKNRWLIPVIAGAVVLLCGAGGIGLLLHKKKKKTGV